MSAPVQTRTVVPLEAPQDGELPAWIMLLPAGKTIATRDGRGPYRVSNAAKMIAESMREAGGKLPIDENHATDYAAPEGRPSPARGWIVEMQMRADGIWGRVEWTGEGKRLVADRAYRDISPVFYHAKNDNDVMRILRASLTNTPNLKGMASLHAEQGPVMEELLKTLRAALGLPEDADASTIAAKVQELVSAKGTHAAKPDPAAFVPMAEFERVVQRMNELNQGMELNAATQHVDGAVRSGKLVPMLREWGIATCRDNRPAFDDFVKRTSKNIQHLSTQVVPSVFSHETHSAAHLDDAESAIATNLGIDAKQFAATRAKSKE